MLLKVIPYLQTFLVVDVILGRLPIPSMHTSTVCNFSGQEWYNNPPDYENCHPCVINVPDDILDDLEEEENFDDADHIVGKW